MNISILQAGSDSSIQVDSSDRGLQFGDGLFETIAIHNGTARFLERHLQRLKQGCHALNITNVDFTQIAEAVKQQAATSFDCVIKLILTAGNSERGYKRPADSEPNVFIRITGFPVFEPAQCITTRLCKTRLAKQPALAGIKHLNRLEQILARNEWNDLSIQEGLLTDMDGLVIEGTMSNIFLVKNGDLHTPNLNNCGVAGIMRSVVIDLAKANDIPVSICQITPDDLHVADEVFLTNSLFEIRPVCEIITVGKYEPGPVTKDLMRMLPEISTQDDSSKWYAE